MTRILFVCHGNICRSPMAEFVFKDMAQKRGIADCFFVQSAATSSEEICGTVGSPVYPPAKAELEKHGISCAGKRAVQLRKDDYDRYDLFVCMDDNNIRNIGYIFPKDPQKKVCKLLDFTANGGNVADPWYTRDFDKAYRDIFDGCSALLETLLQEK
ncbi:MAG: low molecular weight protein-tyrosine-phosphatase [Candidatus Fimenecus sp.]